MITTGVSVAERTAFVKHINAALKDVSELKTVLPLNPNSDEIFEVIKPGVLLCFLVNYSVPETINMNKVVTKFSHNASRIHQEISNHIIALKGANDIGIKTVNISAEDLHQGNAKLICSLFWQTIKIGVLKKVNVIENPDLTQIAEEDEDISDLPAEDLLLKWVNWHLKESGSKLKMAEFSDDNSLQYLHLMHKLAPSVVTLDTVDELDSMERAEMVLQQAKKIGIESIIAPDDIVSGNEKLNLVFMAELFNKHTGFASEIDKLKEENDALRKANSTLQSELDDAHNQISLLSTKLNELSKLNIVLETEKSTFQSDLQQVTVEMRDMEVSMNRIVASKKAVHHVAEKLQAVNEELSQALETATMAKSVAEHQNEVYQAQLQELSTENAKLNEQVAIQTQEKEFISEKLQSVDEEKRQVIEFKKRMEVQFEEVSAQLNMTAEELEKEKLNHSVVITKKRVNGETYSVTADLEELRANQSKLEYFIEFMKKQRIRSDIHISRLRILYGTFKSNEELSTAIYRNIVLGHMKKDANKTGYLLKKNRTGNAWKKRFFVLRDNFFFYYETEKDLDAYPKGVVRLDDCTLRFAENPTKTNLNDSWLLCIDTPHHTNKKESMSFFIAADRQTLESWMSELKLAAGWWTNKSNMKN